MFFLIVSLIATVGGVASLAASLGLPRTSVLLTAFWVLLVSQIVIESLVVGGIFESLRPGPLCAAAVVVGVAEAGWALRRARSAVRQSKDMVGAALARSISRTRRHPSVVILFVIVAAQYLLQMGEILRLPQVSYDSLSYHLIGAATWIQHGAIVHSPDNLFSDAYPADQELTSAWFGDFIGTLRYVGLCTMTFVAMGSSAVVMICRLLNVRRHLAVLAGLGFAAIPAVFLLVSTAYVDVAAGATVIAGLGFAIGNGTGAKTLTGRPSGAVAMLFLAGCAAGLAAGTKSVNLVPALLIVLIGAWQFWRASPDPWEAPNVRWAAPLLLPIAGLGAFWYVRTWVTYGSPFYPVTTLGFKGLGSDASLIIGANEPASLRHVALGPVGQMFVSWWHDMSRHPYTYDQRPGGLGPQWLIFGVPALIGASTVFLRRHRVWFCGLIVPVLIVSFASGAAWLARYTFALAAVGMICLAFCVEWLKVNLKGRLIRFAGSTVTALFVLVTAVGMWWASDPTYFQLTNSQMATIGQLTEIIFQPDPTTKFAVSAPFATIDDTVPSGASVAYAGNDEPIFTYPLVGQNLQRNLVRLGPFDSAQQLAVAMYRRHLRYVVVGPYGSVDAQLWSTMGTADNGFQILVGGGALYGQDLFELVGCPNPSLVLTHYQSTRAALTVTGHLSDDCGPEKGQRVELVRGTQGYPLSGTHRAPVQQATTDAAGDVTFTIADPPKDGLYALVQVRAADATATAYFTPQRDPYPAK